MRNVKTAAISNKQAPAIKNEGGNNNTLGSFHMLIAKNKESSAKAAIVIATIFIFSSLRLNLRLLMFHTQLYARWNKGSI